MDFFHTFITIEAKNWLFKVWSSAIVSQDIAQSFHPFCPFLQTKTKDRRLKMTVSYDLYIITKHHWGVVPHRIPPPPEPMICQDLPKPVIQPVPVRAAEAGVACFPSLPSQRHSLHLAALFPSVPRCFFVIPRAACIWKITSHKIWNQCLIYHCGQTETT